MGHAGGNYSRFTAEDTEAGGGITEMVQVSLDPRAVRLPLAVRNYCTKYVEFSLSDSQ